MTKRVLALLLAVLLILPLPAAAVEWSQGLPSGANVVRFAPSNVTLSEGWNATGGLSIVIRYATPTGAQINMFGSGISSFRLLVEYKFSDETEGNITTLDVTDGGSFLELDARPQGYTLDVRICFYVTAQRSGTTIDMYSEWAEARISGEADPFYTPPKDSEPQGEPQDVLTFGEPEPEPEPEPEEEPGIELEPLPLPSTPPETWTASGWAIEEVKNAHRRGLIPERLATADLKQGATRLEFVEICVQVYLAMTGETMLPTAVSPFIDCDDLAARYAYQLGITNGTSGSVTNATLKFEPNKPITRQDAATMLARVYKRAVMPGWSIATDGKYDFSYTAPAPFADDSVIAAYAKQNVYYMAANSIIKGEERGGQFYFNPYGNITREQALLIGVRMLDNLYY